MLHIFRDKWYCFKMFCRDSAKNSPSQKILAIFYLKLMCQNSVSVKNRYYPCFLRRKMLQIGLEILKIISISLRYSKFSKTCVFHENSMGWTKQHFTSTFFNRINWGLKIIFGNKWSLFWDECHKYQLLSTTNFESSLL